MAESNEKQNAMENESKEKETLRGLQLSADIAILVDEIAEYESRSFKNAAEQLIRYGYEKFCAIKRATESINMAS